MKTMKVLCIAAIVFSAISFSSCKKDSIILPDTEHSSDKPGDSESPQDTIPSDTIPQDTIPTDSGDTEQPQGPGNLLSQMGTIKLSYDATYQLTGYDSYSNIGYTIVYENGRPVRLNFTKHPSYAIYTYEGDLVSEIVTYNGYNEVSYRHHFTYANGKLIRESQRSYISGFLTVDDYSYDANGNLIRIAVSGAASGQESDLKFSYNVLYGNYDSQPNPMPLISSEYYLPGVKLFTNNPGYRETPSSKELYTYVYSSAGLPVERATKLEGYSHVPAAIHRYSYW
ncbi:hypothetical protein QNI22_39980 [Cytophagaceae bacterium BD1B2-1]|uniref:DUF4595 domain-containing protein n=2 Tax=Xanthocytophaga agilis TaxID=3048010 RepID=A0AAE3RBI0_9BACT|nr:hypothetical protein [Xanthocytophaga agilis]